VNQDVLNLYKKAQNGGLNAQEVFWLEGQAAAHPCFGMAYMILARHHFRNQSTIKNKSLLKAAAYANNRTLLRHYLEDTLVQPKVRPIPVAEMRPILEKKTAEVTPAPVAEVSPKPADPVENEVQKPVEIEDSIVPVPEVEDSLVPVAEVEDSIVPLAEVEDSIVPVAEVEDSIIPVAEVEDAIFPVAEVEDAIVPVAEVEDSIVPVAEVEDSIVPVAEIEDSIVPVAEVEDSIIPVAEVEDSLVPVAEVEDSIPPVAAAATFVNPTPPLVNWFLHMRIKLRVDKFKNLGNRIRKGVSTFAPTLEEKAAESSSNASQPLDSTAERNTANSIVADPTVSTLSADAPESPTTILDENVQPLTEKSPSEAPSLEPVESISAISLKDTPSDAKENEVAHSVVSPETELTSETAEKKPKTPEKEYEIGAFSSFTFLSEGSAGEGEEEIEAELAILDAVEFQRSEGNGGSGEIIFEENDRIIEITVSPAALDKYFKGRLPMEPPVSFGEFTIEFDAFELRSNETILEQFPESVEVSGKPVAPSEALIEGEQPRKKVDEILEKFIENEPSITRGKAAASPTGDLAKDSCHVDDEWVTETLARIYEKQGNRNKAIKIYEKLRLRFPEKSGYFADLIVKLKQ
jgi:hypothetical protein